MTHRQSSLGRAAGGTLIGLCLLAACWEISHVALASASPGEALYRVGRQLLSEGKIEPAVRKFDEAIAADPSGGYADDALLAAATIDYAADSVEELGSASSDRIERARPRLTRITTEYRGSDSAPQATYRLGLLQMDPMNRKADLNEAFATFLQVARLYPQSPEAADSLYAAGLCHRLQGSLVAAASDDEQIVLEHSDSRVADRSRLRLAEGAAILGEASLAKRLLASLASVPPDPVAAGGSALAKLIDRAGLDTPAAPGAREFAGAFPSGDGLRELSAIGVDADGALLVLDESTHKVLRDQQDAPATGGFGPAPPEGARGFVVGGWGLYFWDDRGIILPDGSRFEPLQPPQKEGDPAPVKRIGGIAVEPLGEMDVLDTSENRILRYGRDRAFQRIVARLEAKPTAIVRWQTTLFVLIESRREVVAIRQSSGAEPRRIPLRGQGWELTSPVAIALDTLGRLYVLDDSARSVTVLDKNGERVANVASVRTSPGEFRSPAALAVDPSGAVYVADKRTGKVLRFR